MTSSLDTQLESVPAKPDPLHPQMGWRGSLYVDTPGDLSFAQELSLNNTRSRKVSQNLRKRPELKLNSSTGKIWSMWIRSFAYGFQVIAATVILYAVTLSRLTRRQISWKSELYGGFDESIWLSNKPDATTHKKMLNSVSVNWLTLLRWPSVGQYVYRAPQTKKGICKKCYAHKWQAYTISSNKSYYDVKRKIIMVWLVNDDTWSFLY